MHFLFCIISIYICYEICYELSNTLILIIMKKIIYILLITLSFQSQVMIAQTQTCKNNLLSNPSFNSGISSGWSQFDFPTAWIKTSNPGCIDTFILLGSGSSLQGGIQQDISFDTAVCYDICLCLSSDQYSRARIFLATADTSLTGKKLRYNTYNTGSAQLLDTIDVSATNTIYCKKSWVPSKNYSRIIILNTPQPNNNGAELFVDNVCISVCASSGIRNQAFPEGIKINNSPEKISVTFNNTYFDCEIVEITGKTVRQFRNVENIELSKNELNQGIYILRVIKDGMVYTQRVVF